MGIAAAITGLGAGIGAAGQLKAGSDAKKAGDRAYKTGMAQGQDALLRGTKEEARYRREVAMIAGHQKADFGARNVAVSGTPLDILSDTAQIGEEDALTIRNNAAREAWGYRNQAAEDRRAGKNARTQSYFGAGGTLLTGGSKIYDMKHPT